MLCEKCGKNEATTHIHSIIKGVLMASHVCSSCAAKAGYGDVSEKNLEQMLSYVFGDSISEKKEKSTMSCPCCGMTFAEISQIASYGSNWSDWMQNILTANGAVKKSKQSTLIWLKSFITYEDKIKDSKAILGTQYEEIHEVFTAFGLE